MYVLIHEVPTRVLAADQEENELRGQDSEHSLDTIKAVAHWPIFCRRTADFLSGSIGLKFVVTSACRTLADFFVATNRV